MSTVNAWLEEAAFDADTTHAMGLAYDKLAREIGLEDNSDGINKIVAQRIIDAARTGERDPDKLCVAATDALLGLNGKHRTT